MKHFSITILFLFIFFCAVSVSAQNEKKIAFGILLDNTGSMRTQFSKVKNIGKLIVQEIYKKGEISLFNFKTAGIKNKETAQVGAGMDWSHDEKILNNYIDTIEVIGGQTMLLDSILSTAKAIDLKFEAEKDKFSEKILILITDGEDRESDLTQKELIDFLNKKKIKVLAVGLVEELSSEAGFTQLSPQTKATEFLKKITKKTNGKVVFPKSKEKIEDVIKDLFAQ